MYRYRIDGRLRRINLGVYRDDRRGVSLAEARRRYFKARTLARIGRATPSMSVIERLRRSESRRSAKRNDGRLRTLIEHHVEESRSGADKKRSWAADAANLKRDIPASWLERPAESDHAGRGA